MAARWVIPSDDVDGKAAALAKALGIGGLTARVLVHRGFAEADSAARFLAPSLDDLHSPFLLRDMDRAVERLLAAISRHEKILIYGDYDVDGALSVVLLVKAIELAGGAAEYHVPHRLQDGYGMRSEVVERAAAEGVHLIVSVDTGIRAAEVVAHAAGLGIDVIVTDHHLPEAALPPAVAVLNPNRPDCAYPEKHLCGAGVAFKLAQALFEKLGWPDARRRRVAESLLKLVAMATVADVVPLLGENRAMVSVGLAGLGDPRNPGLRALLSVAGFPPGTAPNARQVAFQLAPRMNAAGRMDTARAVIELFLSADAERAAALAAQLEASNTERQRVEAAIREACEQTPFDPAASALVFYDAEWHRGVVGIVASRMVERFGRPAFVLGRHEDGGLAQGSGRGIAAFHLLDALESMSDLFVRFGGHRHAAGVTLDPTRVGEFRARLNAYAAARLTPEDFLPRLEVDAEASLDEIHEQSARGIWRLGPFGHGNPPPLVLARAVELAGPPVPLKEKHLRLAVRGQGRSLKLKGWNLAARAGELTPGVKLDILFTLDEDAYSAARGYPPWSATLRDFRPAALTHAAV